MAIIVDKEQKKRDIALACKSLILEKGINNITVSEVAKSAGIGKGTVYEYFKDKNEIIFELVNVLMLAHSEKLKAQLDAKDSTKEKIRTFSSFFYNEEDKNLRQLYKEFVALSLIAPNADMIAFHKQCINNYYTWFIDILYDGVKNEELRPEALQLAKALFVIGDGMFIHNSVIGMQDNLQNDLNIFIDTIFDLMETK